MPRLRLWSGVVRRMSVVWFVLGFGRLRMEGVGSNGGVGLEEGGGCGDR